MSGDVMLTSFFLQVQTHILGPEAQGYNCQRGLHVEDMRKMRNYHQSEPRGSLNLYLQRFRTASLAKWSCNTQCCTVKPSLCRRDMVLFLRVP